MAQNPVWTVQLQTPEDFTRNIKQAHRLRDQAEKVGVREIVWVWNGREVARVSVPRRKR